jgi:hypothetical protein
MTGNSDRDDDNASDCSSSSGDEGYESPPMSDVEGSDKETSDIAAGGKRKKASDDLFGYEPQQFHKQSDNGKLPPPSSTNNRKSAKRNKTVENKILLLERKRQARLRQKAKRDHDLLGDSDEDSDVEFFCLGAGKNKKKGKEETEIDSVKNIRTDTAVVKLSSGNNDRSNKKPHISVVKKTAIELLSSCDSSPASKTKGVPATATTAANRRPFSSSNAIPNIPRATTAAAAATQALSCLSSDDDSDAEDLTSMPPTRPINLPPALAASLKQAQQAKARLEQAQDYHAHDIHVAVQETVYVPTAPPVNKPAPPHVNPIIKMDMGEALEFTCRCGHVVINGRKEPTAKDKQSTVLTVREKEPLSSLVEKFCRAHSLPRETVTIAMTFDGRKLDINKTPVFYEMEHEDLIDVSASAPRRSTTAEQQRIARPFANAPTKTLVGQRSGSMGLSLQFSCRTQIKVATNAPAPNQGARRPKRQKQQPPSSKPKMVTKTVELCENERLGVLAKRLCAILGDLPLSTTKVVMRFDGCVLDPEKSPKFYDMEDKDMIEVSIEKKEQQTNVSCPPAPLRQQHRPPVGNDTIIYVTLVPQKGKCISLTPESREPLSTLMKDYKDKLMASSSNNGTADINTTRATQRRSNRKKSNNDGSTELLFRYRGKVLDLTKTPSDYKMISLDQIDVIDVISMGVAAGSRTTRSSSRKSNNSNSKNIIHV